MSIVTLGGSWKKLSKLCLQEDSILILKVLSFKFKGVALMPFDSSSNLMMVEQSLA
jgi:hypothetical protein